MKITINDQTRLYEIIRKVTESKDAEIEIYVTADSVYSRHPGNIMFIEQTARNLGKSVKTNRDPVELPTLPDKPDERVEVKLPSESGKDSKSEIPLEGELPQNRKQSDEPAQKAKRKGRFLSPKKILVFMAILLLFSAGSALAYVYYYLPRATVTLYVAEKVLERSVVATVDPKIEKVSQADLQVPGQVITVEIQNSADFPVTGKKTVGDKAHGVVQIQNFTKGSFSITPGATLRASSAEGEILEFVSTNQSTTVVPAAVETMPKPGTKQLDAGQAELPVEASTFGEKYNVAGSTTFILVVGGLTTTDVTIANAAPFSGGTIREVDAVAQVDIDQAQEQLKNQAFAGVGEKLKANLQPGFTYSDSTVNNSTKFIQFNHEVGEEASQLTGTIKVQSMVTAYSKGDVESLLDEEIKANVPENFELSDTGSSLNVEDAQADGDRLTIKARMITLVVPVLDKDQIRSEILGKKISTAESFLKSIQQTDGFDIRLSPNLPEPLRVMPSLKERLEIQVEVRK